MQLNKIKKNLFLLCGIAITGMMAQAQDKPVLLFPQGAPGETTVFTEKVSSEGSPVGGATVLRITDVSAPTVTVYQAPDELASGAAVVVCPGGGYNILAYDLEGTEVCQWLNEMGVTAVLLKYRVPRRTGKEKHEAPLQDLQRAIGYVRAHADELNIDPARIGVLGFSAGAHLAAMGSTHFNERTYPAVDAADRISCRPDFCVLVYPAYLSGDTFRIAPELNVNASVPPTLIIQAEDDKQHIDSSLFYYYALKEAGVPAAMHLYPAGGHGYGLRDTQCAVNEWPYRVEDWLNNLGIIELSAGE